MQRRIGWLLATIIGIVAIIVVLVLYRSNEQPTRVRTMAEVNLKHNKQPFAKKVVMMMVSMNQRKKI